MVSAINRPRAFSLAELVLALGLITVVVLGLAGLALYSMTAGQKSRDLAAGELVAEQALERLVYDAESNPGAAVWGQDSATAVYAQQLVTLDPTVFNVTTYVTNVAPTTFDPATNQRLKRLDVVVIWQEAQQGKANQGRLQVASSRLLHEP